MNLQEIKEAARQAYKDQQTQDNEGGCGEPVGFVTGYIQGYEDCKSELSSNKGIKKDTIEKIINLLFILDTMKGDPDYTKATENDLRKFLE